MQIHSTEAGIHSIGDTAAGGFDGYSAGVSWGAVLAGAAAAAALSFILLMLGFGLGLSAVSPWSYHPEMIGKSTIAWLAFMQLAAASIGGYIAGRLRVKWPSVHSDEVYFRDTAHGFLAWAVATLITAALMAGAVRAVLSGAIDVGIGAAPALSVAGSSRDGDGAINYFADVLLRSDPAIPDADNGALRMEVGKIFANDLQAGALALDDRQYLASLVAKRTGLSQVDAARRVDDVHARLSKASAEVQAAAKAAADKVRKAAAYSALWMFIALLLGAFFASLCATFGGRQRDGRPRR